MAGSLLSNGLGVGIALDTTETARISIDEVAGTTTIIGSGTALGPGRRIDLFEDVIVHGNLEVLGYSRVSYIKFPDGGAGTETPRISIEVAADELSIIGAGITGSPYQRVVRIYDNLEVSYNFTVGNDTVLNGSVTVDSEATATPLITLEPVVGNARGDISFGTTRTSEPSSPSEGDVWYNSTDHELKVFDGTTAVHLNSDIPPVHAAGTFHAHTRGGITHIDLVGGHGWHATPAMWGAHLSVGPPYVGFSVAMLALSVPILGASITVTPWIPGHYDEATPPETNRPLLALSPSVTVWTAQILAKGAPPNPLGAALPSSICAQQIDLAFFDNTGAHVPAPLDPNPGVVEPSDIMFDVHVVGSPCTP